MLTEERIQYQDDFFPRAGQRGIGGYHAPRVSCQVPQRRAVYHFIELEPGDKPLTNYLDWGWV